MKISVVVPILLVLLSSVESARRCKVAESRKPNAIESASSYWERALVVNVDKQESLLVRRECVNNRLIIPGKEKQTYCDMGGCEQSQECYEFKIPNDYLSGKGVAPNELVLFVKNVYFGVCDEYVVAWASFCDRDPTNGRPFVGIVNFCPSVDDILKTEDYDLILTAKHELGHVLNDILTPNRLESNLVSRILLAYFKDTKKQDIQPFCDTPWEKRCINYDRAIGRCSLFDSETELPLHFQYADNSFNVPRDKQTYYSGPDIYDYCPVYEMFKLYNGRTSACRFNLNLKSDLINNEYLEDMGPDSTCFDHEKILRKNKTTNEAYPRTSSCHKYKCSKNADLQVIINGKSFPCRAGDRSAHLKLEVQNVEFSTDIHCPPCQSVCNVG
ncbi:leishmanolysin-like peptidase [Schistosoma bovis]|uniref:Leishmanolysin-like peptidase n=1 Tax=Schistosoma bovis TaxID=6184 RepID=A0A430Q224_SCHBO|nr:leishmanolysin-like peptidase [Schistosoma bovis]